jgi:glycosyltransferase involved in cell wall biosynthesis
MNMVLFIGNFLGKHLGTTNPSEQIANSLANEGMAVSKASTYKNRLFRLSEMFWKSLLLPYRILHVDVFSGKSLWFAEWTAAIGNFRGKKVILTLHGGKLPEVFALSPKRFHRLFSNAHHLFTPSRMLQNFFSEKGFIVEWLPNFIRLGTFPMSLKNDLSQTLLWVRAFSYIYNPEVAIHTLHKVRESYPNAMLTMVGPDKGELGNVKNLIEGLNLEHAIRITGPIPNEELYKFYHTHNVYINTTSYESFGVAVMEAAACGIPIVSTNVGEIPYLWKDEEEILMVDNIEPATFAIQINRIFADRSLAKKLSINARKKAEQFDWEVIKPKWVELLTQNNVS